MTGWRASLLPLALVAGACASNPFRGGYSRPDERLAGVKVLASFVTGHCEDATHTEVTSHVALIELGETQSGQLLLLEHREGYDLLVAENFHDDGAAWVFQVLVRADDLLREWRVPQSANATGSLVVGREFSEASNGARFRAQLASPRLTCTLVPKASLLPIPSAKPEL